MSRSSPPIKLKADVFSSDNESGFTGLVAGNHLMAGNHAIDDNLRQRIDNDHDDDTRWRVKIPVQEQAVIQNGILSQGEGHLEAIAFRIAVSDLDAYQRVHDRKRRWQRHRWSNQKLQSCTKIRHPLAPLRNRNNESLTNAFIRSQVIGLHGRD